MRSDARRLAAEYDLGVAERGFTLSGIGWPNPADLATRFETLFSAVDLLRYSRERPLRLLDVGCGPAFLLDYLAANDLIDQVDYTGVDISEPLVEHARARWPGRRFERRDLRDEPFADGAFDYAVICGVFGGRCGLSHHDMRALTEATLTSLWPAVAEGLSFNVMSKHVDWERDDLFHWPLDDIMAFCKAKLSRHVAMRLDYGLWETAVFVRKAPSPAKSEVPDYWLTNSK
jgi:SAM-dependent methyltransferase